MAGILGKWGYFAGFVIFLTMCLFVMSKILFTDTQLLSSDVLYKVINVVTICVTVIIVAVPEGLPMAISIAMAFSVTDMKEDQLMIKNLEACETMGTVTEICTGKTATLTNNNMSVQ